MHEVVVTKLVDATKLLDVIILSDDPAFVWKEEVTVKDMELSEVDIMESLLGSP